MNSAFLMRIKQSITYGVMWLLFRMATEYGWLGIFNMFCTHQNS